MFFEKNKGESRSSSSLVLSSLPPTGKSGPLTVRIKLAWLPHTCAPGVVWPKMLGGVVANMKSIWGLV